MKEFDSHKRDILILAFFDKMMIVSEYTFLVDEFYINQVSLENYKIHIWKEHTFCKYAEQI